MIFYPTPENATKSIDLIVAVSDGVFAVGYELINPRDEPEFLYAFEDLSGEFFDPHLYSFSTEEYIEYSPLHTVQVNLGGAIEAFGIGKTVSDVNRMGAYEYSKTLKPSQGVYLEIYGNKLEQEIIDFNFIEVRLQKETYLL